MTYFNYKNIDLYTLYDQIKFEVKNFIPGAGSHRSELEAATDAALSKRMAHIRDKRMGEPSPEWPEVPLAKDMHNVTRQDWVRLEQWCITMMDIEATLNQAWEEEQEADTDSQDTENTPPVGDVRPDTPPAVTELEAKILDYLNGEFPQLRNITEIANGTKLDRKTIRKYLDTLANKGLVDAQNVITQKGRDYISEYFS